MFRTNMQSDKGSLCSLSSIVESVDLARMASQTAATRTDSSACLAGAAVWYVSCSQAITSADLARPNTSWSRSIA